MNREVIEYFTYKARVKRLKHELQWATRIMNEAENNLLQSVPTEILEWKTDSLPY